MFRSFSIHYLSRLGRALRAEHRLTWQLGTRLVGGGLALGLLAVYWRQTSEHGYFLDLHPYGTRKASDGSLYSALSTWSEAEASLVRWYLLCVVPASLLLAWLGTSFVKVWESVVRLGKKVSRSWSASLLAVVLMAEVAASVMLVLRQTPLTDDELAYLFQAEILLEGKLTLASQPPVRRPHFDNVFVINNGSWYTQYPFGHPAVLIPGVAIGFPHLMPILLAGLTLVISCQTAQLLYGREVGVLTGLLFCVSPFYIFTSSTLLSHSSTCFLVALSLWCLALAVERKMSGFLFWSGLALGILVHFRPHLTALFGIPALALIVWSRLVSGSDGQRGLWHRTRTVLGRALVLWGVGLALPIGLYFAVNYLVNDDPLITNYDVYWKRYYERKDFENTTVLGFGTYPWGIQHTPELGWRNTWLNAVRLGFWLFGNPVLLVFTLAAVRFKLRRAWSVMFLAIPILFYGFHFFYFWPGISDTGPVFYSELIPVLLIATAHGVAGAGSGRLRSARAGACLAIPLIVGLCCFVPIQCGVLTVLQRSINAPYQELARWAEVHAPEAKLLVFMAEQVQPGPKIIGWVMSRPNPRPDLSDTHLYVLDLGMERNKKMARFYPDRIPILVSVKPDRSIAVKRLLLETIMAPD